MEQQENKETLENHNVVFDIEIFSDSVPFIKNLDGTYSFIDTGSSNCILNTAYLNYIVDTYEGQSTTTTANGSINVKFCLAKLPFTSRYCYDAITSDDIGIFKEFKKDHGIECSMIIGTEFLNSVNAVLDFDNKKLIMQL